MPKEIRAIIVDDHQMLRDGLKHILTEIGYISLIGEASNGKEFLQLLDVSVPDLVLMDINMPVMDGIEATRVAKERFPDLKILVLTMYSEEQYYHSMVELGVNGFILKHSGYEELERAIQAILSGNHYFSQELLINILKQKSTPSVIQLSKREQQILMLICKGFSNNEIAEKLFLSPRTIEGHRSELMSKTHTSNAIGLVIYAIKNKLIAI